MTDRTTGSSLTALVHAFLFAEGGVMSKKKLAKLTGCDQKTLSETFQDLSKRLVGLGITLIETETEISLAADAETSSVLRTMFKKEHGEEIGNAGLEVLAIVLYRGPSTRTQIDYIRGVNTSWTLRGLLSRGLLERTENPNDAREYLYRPTAELLAHLGVQRAQELPEYATIASELNSFESQIQNNVFSYNSTTSSTDT